MRSLGRRLLWLAVPLAVALALAAPAQARTLNVTAHDGDGYWFEVEGKRGRNPDLALSPGDTVTVNLRNAGALAHDLNFDPPVAGSSRGVIPPGASKTFTFDVPEDFDEEVSYYCHPHAAMGMAGIAGSTEGKSAPALPLAAALLACLGAACFARR